MIARIIALTEKKPVLALVTVLLIGLSALAGVIRILDSRREKDKREYQLSLAKCNEENRQIQIKNQKHIDDLNEKFEKVILKNNDDLQERIDRVDNVTRNSKKAVYDAKSTVKSQGRIIKQLNSNTNDGK